MKIDISRVNLLEKDIEDWLYDNPDALYGHYPQVGGGDPITEWIGRQYNLPSGIADLIGVRESGRVVVVEVKNVAVSKAAILQVCRYTNDVKRILASRVEYKWKEDGLPEVEMIVAGTSADAQTFTEAQALDVRVFTFEAQMTLQISALAWGDDYALQVRAEQSRLSALPEWDRFGPTIDEAYCRDEDSEPTSRRHMPDEYSDIILG